MIDPKELADRYVAVWIEFDTERRRKHITQLWAEDGVHSFRARDNAARLDEVVKFNWEMVRTSDGEVAGVGLKILVLDDDGRIHAPGGRPAGLSPTAYRSPTSQRLPYTATSGHGRQAVRSRNSLVRPPARRRAILGMAKVVLSLARVGGRAQLVPLLHLGARRAVVAHVGTLAL